VPGDRADLVIRSRRVVLSAGEQPAAVFVRDGKIAAVTGYDARPGAGTEADLGDVALLPGLVDTHVHVNEPGHADWEGFATATRAAAAGGVTTICDMPLNSLPPTTTVAALRAKIAAARGQCAVNVAFWGGAVPDNTGPGGAGQLTALHEAGVVGFKCFLADSGMPPLDAAGLRAAMGELAPLGAPLIVHAEDRAEISQPDGPGYDAFLASRPPRAERRAIEKVIAAAAATGARAHIVHLSAAECAALIAGAKGAGIALTAETCPHYLFFTSGEIPDGDTRFKCCPPLRDGYNREALWRALQAGVIDCVVSDHSPSPPALKDGGFDTAWGGIASLQTGLQAVWKVAQRRGIPLSQVVTWMATAPADLAGLPGKGRIAPGADADLVAFDASAEVTVRAEDLRYRHPVTPYEGRTLAGRVERVWLSGTEVSDVTNGRLLRRGGGTLD
jgi:allantoinase